MGREFTCLIAENVYDISNPHNYCPFEILYPDNEDFKYFDLKNVNYDEVKI